jgi:hypothetical protein
VSDFLHLVNRALNEREIAEYQISRETCFALLTTVETLPV